MTDTIQESAAGRVLHEFMHECGIGDYAELAARTSLSEADIRAFACSTPGEGSADAIDVFLAIAEALSLTKKQACRLLNALLLGTDSGCSEE